ncbi:MAG: hypothetical protein K0R17_477 [Rariglobus sp.]|jgi:hypothetical protein|nr:hypothetical protein [Rariglobus sp.]
MKILRSAPLSLLLGSGLVLALSGCTTVKLDRNGDTAAVYQLNEFRMLLNTTAPTAFAATQKAFREYDLFETKSKLNTYDGELYARSRKDEKVFVSVAEINSRQTLLRIRWSTTGDKKNSQALYDLIEKNLR